MKQIEVCAFKIIVGIRSKLQ